jgi:acetyl/propionyl-CoA carboxylase alpha subunit
MRVAHNEISLRSSINAAQSEAEAAFKDGTIFIEKYIEEPRHIEVQMLGDKFGNIIHLYERDCTLQRRHQKLVEESPCPIIDQKTREEICASAVRLAKEANYYSAGTCEFIMDKERKFYFMEVNTRIQVEHPVTELITGLDLVAEQLRIAEGRALEKDPPRPRGHAIEARLYAEDPARDWAPQTGTLHRLAVPPGVRLATGNTDRDAIGVHYDPMLAKVIAHGPTRRDAARRLARALARARVHGVTTNRDLLVGILREPEFLAGRTDTGYLTRHDPAALGAPAEGAVRLPAAAAALAQQAANRAEARVLATLPSGWRYVATAPQRTRFTHGEREIEVAYRIGPGEPFLAVDGEPLPGVRLLDVRPDRVDLEVDGVRRSFAVERRGEISHVDGPGGGVELAAVPRFVDPAAAAHVGSLLAPMPGTVLRVLAEAGGTVVAGQPLVVLEAMKMEHTVSAPADGTLTEVNVGPGDQVDTGLVMAVVEADEAGATGKAEDAEGAA